MKQIKILCCLLSEKGFSELREAVGFNDMTLSRHLKRLESNGNIKHNHLNRKYNITPKGTILLNNLISTLSKDIQFIDLCLQLRYKAL